MDTVNFDSRPNRQQLDAYISVVAWRCVELSGKLREAQVSVLSSRSPEQLAAAIATFQGHMVTHAANWAALARQAEGWSTADPTL
jgi:hypothetical protein